MIIGEAVAVEITGSARARAALDKSPKVLDGGGHRLRADPGSAAAQQIRGRRIETGAGERVIGNGQILVPVAVGISRQRRYRNMFSSEYESAFGLGPETLVGSHMDPQLSDQIQAVFSATVSPGEGQIVPAILIEIIEDRSGDQERTGQWERKHRRRRLGQPARRTHVDGETGMKEHREVVKAVSVDVAVPRRSAGGSPGRGEPQACGR